MSKLPVMEASDVDGVVDQLESDILVWQVSALRVAPPLQFA